jgi:hypothetical protein
MFSTSLVLLLLYEAMTLHQCQAEAWKGSWTAHLRRACNRQSTNVTRSALKYNNDMFFREHTFVLARTDCKR